MGDNIPAFTGKGVKTTFVSSFGIQRKNHFRPRKKKASKIENFQVNKIMVYDKNFISLNKELFEEPTHHEVCF